MKRSLFTITLLSLLLETICVPVSAQLSIVKSASTTFLQNGTIFTYTLNVQNFGTGATQNNLTVVDQLPSGIILQSFTSDFPGLTVSPFLPVTGPSPVTFGPFSIQDNFSENINLQVAVTVNFANGVVQNIVNGATLYQQKTPVASSNALGEACAGTLLTFHPHKGVGTTGNAMCLCGPDCGTVVGDGGAIGTWNGSTVTDVNSPTTEDLLGVDCCNSSGVNLSVAVGKKKTILYNTSSPPNFQSLSAAIPSVVGNGANFTNIKIINCKQAYITGSNGELLFSPDIFQTVADPQNNQFKLIRGAASGTCPSDGRQITGVDVTADGNWLLIVGQGGLFDMAPLPLGPLGCAAFVPVQFTDGTTPVGSITAVKVMGDGEIFATSASGDIFFSQGNTSRPTFVNLKNNPTISSVVGSAKLSSLDGTDSTHVIFGSSQGNVFLFTGTSIQNLGSVGGGINAVKFLLDSKGNIIGYFVLCTCTQSFQFICLPPSSTPTPTPSFTPSFTPTPTPTPPPLPSFTPTPSPSPTPALTPTPTITPSPTPTPTFTPTFTPPTPPTHTPSFTPPPSSTFTPTFPPATATSTAIPGNGGNGNGGGFPPGILPPGVGGNGGGNGIGNQPPPVGTVVGSNGTLGGFSSIAFSLSCGVSENVAVGLNGLVAVMTENFITGTTSIRIVPVVVGGVTLTTDFFSITRCNPSNWVIVGAKGTIVQTADSGATWQQVDLSPFTSGPTPPNLSTFLKQTNLRTVTNNGTCGRYQVTGLNGTLWELTASGGVINGGSGGIFIDNYSFNSTVNPALFDPTVANAGVRFEDNFLFGNERWIVGRDNNGQGFILQDPGTGTFRRDTLPLVGGVVPPDITSIFEQSSNDIWAVGTQANGSNIILHSSDDGASWQTFPQLESIIQPAANILSVEVEPQTGGFKMQATTDTGSVIQVFYADPTNIAGALGTSADFRVVSILDASIVMDVCDNTVCGKNLFGHIIPPAFTHTPTNTATDTATETPTFTSTDSPTNTATQTPTSTSTDTATNTTTNTATDTLTNTATDTPTLTPTNSQTDTATGTPTSSATNTATGTPTNSATNSPTLTPTKSSTNTATQTATNTATPTFACTVITLGGKAFPTGNCYNNGNTASITSASDKVPVIPNHCYKITIVPNTCLTYGGSQKANGQGVALTGTRLRIFQADDTVGSNLTPSGTVGKGSYQEMADNGEAFIFPIDPALAAHHIYDSCANATADLSLPGVNGITVVANRNFLYFTADDIIGDNFCGDNGGTEQVQICEVTCASPPGSIPPGNSNGAVSLLVVPDKTLVSPGDGINLTVSAVNLGNQVVDSYGGVVTFTVTDPVALVPGDHTFQNSEHGTHTFSVSVPGEGTRLFTTGIQTISAKDVNFPSITGISVPITVQLVLTATASETPSVIPTATETGSPTPTFSKTPGQAKGAKSFLISFSASQAIPGQPVTMTVTALKQNESPDTHYLGEVQFSSSDTAATLPSNHVVALTEAGSFTVVIKFGTAGNQTVTVCDISNPSLCGTSQVISVVTPTPTVTPTLTPTPAACVGGYAFLRQWGGFGSGSGKFIAPTGVGVNSSGNVYVSDNGNGRIEKFDSNGNFILQWGGFGPVGNGKFNSPYQIAADSSNNIYVIDQGGIIQKFDSNGNFLGQFGGAGSGNGTFNSPLGIALDLSGNIYVSDELNNLIQKFDSGFHFLLQWGGAGTGNGKFALPEQIAVDSLGFVYVADTNNALLQKFNSNGTFITQWGGSGANGNGKFEGPEGVAVDSSRNVYVSDAGTGLIQKFDSNGSFITQFGGKGTGNGLLSNPQGVVVDSSGNVYAADTINNLVQKFGPCNFTPTITPTPSPTPTCNPCLLATNQPASLVFGQPDFVSFSNSTVNAGSMNIAQGVFRAGNKLIVSDTNNNRVLIYSPVPTGNQPPAVKVIGQASFTSAAANQGGAVAANTLSLPSGVWSDGTMLIVVDAGNDRVLIYNNIDGLPTTNGAADLVIGQTDLANSGGTGNPAGTFSLSSNFFDGVFYDGQRLFITDEGRHRILVFNSLPAVNGSNANEVIGQPDFTGSGNNGGLGSTSAQGLFVPTGLWGSNGSLFVADLQDERVLVFNNVDNLNTNFPAAGTVIGQNSFTTSNVGTSPNSLHFPSAVCVRNCQLYISDTQNNRVLVYNTIPTGTANPPADVVLGQPNFTSNGINQGVFPPQANTLFFPFGIDVVNGVLYTADTQNNRVLQYDCQAGTGLTAATLKVFSKKGNNLISEGPTPTITPTVTITPSPTPRLDNVLVQNVVAAPNVVHGDQPVRLNFTLGHPANVRLSIFTLTGELVFNTTVSGTQGTNSLVWQADNMAQQAVASGLYIYVLQVDDGHEHLNKTGKIVLIR